MLWSALGAALTRTLLGAAHSTIVAFGRTTIGVWHGPLKQQ
jgi:hypothetical protein